MLPFIGKKSLQLRSKLVKSVQNNLSFCHLKVVFQSPYKLHTLFRFKDTLNKKICSHLVYRYSCSSCNATYYGKTYQHFSTRAADHMGISNLTGKRVNPIQNGHFWGCSRMEGAKRSPPSKILSHISCNDETWHNHTLPKEDKKK